MSEIRAKKQAIKWSSGQERQTMEQEIAQLQAELAAHKQKGYQSKQEHKKLVWGVRAQVVRKRKFGDEEQLVEAISTGDPWHTRVPHMQKLFWIHSPKIRSRHEDVVADFFRTSDNPIPLIANYVDEILLKSNPQPHAIDVCEFEAVLKALACHFTTLIRALAADKKFISEIASESYHHDLFDKMVLLSGAKSHYKLRLHIFLPTTFQEAQEEVHSHRNHFVSAVIHGGMTQGIWEETKHHTGPHIQSQQLYKYIYDPKLTAEGTRVFNIDLQGKIDLTRSEEATLTKGQTYYMHPSVLHSVESLAGCTVTLVLNSPQAVTKSCFSTIEPWKDESFVRQKFTEEEVLNQFQFVLNLQ